MKSIIKILLIILVVGLTTADSFGQVRIKADLMKTFDMTPGETVEVDFILESLNETEDIDVHLYQRDYFFLPGEQKQYLDAGDLERSNSGWVTLPDEYVTVPAGEQIQLAYSITAPNDPNLKGSYWSMLIVQPMQTKVNSGSVDQRELVVRKNVRYAIQLVTNVNETNQYDVDITNGRLETVEGEYAFLADVKNNGIDAFVPKVWVEVYNVMGEKIMTENGKAHILYPGTGLTQAIKLDGLEKGHYSALFIVDGGEESSLFGGQYDFEIQ